MDKFSKEITLFIGAFSVLFVLSFSFPFSIIPDVGGWLEPLFNNLVLLEARSFGFEAAPYHSGEDSLGMVVNMLNVLVISLLVYGVLTIKLKTETKELLFTYATVGLRYYLAIILLIYGFDKVYKWQFYAPESNILYTRVKDLPQDMLYWTTMGTSYSYSVFGGVLEVIAGVFLLFRKTSLLGALLSVGVMANVFAVNIGFDVTVKLFSGFLLVLGVVLMLPHLQKIMLFFTGKQVQLTFSVPKYAQTRFYLPVKILILLLLLIESQYKYVKAGNFNDDLAPRPHFNGVYEVVGGVGGISRVHFHRHGYLILEQNDDSFLDYKLEVDSLQHEFILTDYEFSQYSLEYREDADTLWLSSTDGTFSIVTVKRSL